MDRFLFRGKRLDNGEWVKGNVIQMGDSAFIASGWIIEGTTNDFTCFDCDYLYEVDPKTICQCTGWCDSNKIPIFERDIVEFDGASSHKDLIWWCNEMNMITAVPLDGIEFNGFDYWNGNYPKYTYSDFCFMMQDPYGNFKEIKVIGNIIDNPELLEV